MEKNIEIVWVPTKIKPCPFCGKTDKLKFTPKKDYEKLVQEHGSACLTLECLRCNLTLYNHDCVGEGGLPRLYSWMQGKLVEKWNSRKEITDEH